jgi:curved DNA-binding protein CbpA
MQVNKYLKSIVFIKYSHQYFSKTFYQLLEVTEKATNEEIKNAYYKKAKLYHPDLNKSNTDAEVFKTLTNAYEILTDKEKRAEYDKTVNRGTYTYNTSYKPNPYADDFRKQNNGGFYYHYTKNDSYSKGNHNYRSYRVYKNNKFDDQFYQPEPDDFEFTGKHLLMFVIFTGISVAFVTYCFITSIQHRKTEGFYYKKNYLKPIGNRDALEAIIEESTQINRKIKENKNM